MTQETKGTVVALQINKDNKRVSTESTYQLFEGGNRVYSAANKPTPADIGALGKTETAANSSAAGRLDAVDDRDVKPNTTGISTNIKAVKPFFVQSATLGTGSDYTDLLMIDTYSDSSGGKPNALAFNKSSKMIYHLQPDFDGTSWGTAHALYTEAHKPTPAEIGALPVDGNAKTATWADTVDVNTSTATSYYGVVWHSGDTLFASENQGFTVRPSDGHVKMKHLTINDNIAIHSNGWIRPANTDSRDAGMYGVYDSNRIGHIWSMGESYKIPTNGADFGNLYGFAYKHTNNATGGTMAGGHQAVWVTNGSPKVALGESGIWTSGKLTAGGGIAVNSEHIATSVDFNNYETTGFYNMYKGSGVTFTNAPPSFSYGTLQVIGRGKAGASFATQIVTFKEDGRQYIRARNDGAFAWTPWRKIYSEAQKPTAADVGLSYISQNSSYGAQVALSGKFVRIGCRNTSWCHLETDATSGFYSYDHFEVPSITARDEVRGITGVNAEGTASGQGLQYYGKTAIGGTNDGWMRLNPHSQFGSGIYCGNGVLRNDGQIQVGSYATATKSMRFKVGTGTSWGADKDAFIDMCGAPTSGSTATYLMRYRNTAGARIFAIDTLDQGGQTVMRIGASGTFTMTPSGDFTASGNSGAYSDERIKTDVKTIDNALDKVLKIRGVTYKRTDIESDKRHAGVIAQEIEKVLPEVVSISKNNENGIEDFRSVSYGNISALLIEAIKEQQVQIESLKKEINLLKSN
ncbi:tail fiber domain-containing protein [Vibrio parahaemolyticus]|nr:tail fiber domain-containing protein [Vibrio parahaemolyticus]